DLVNERTRAGGFEDVAVSSIGLEFECVLGDQRKHDAVQIKPEAAEHRARAHRPEPAELIQDMSDERVFAHNHGQAFSTIDAQLWIQVRIPAAAGSHSPPKVDPSPGLCFAL